RLLPSRGLQTCLHPPMSVIWPCFGRLSDRMPPKAASIPGSLRIPRNRSSSSTSSSAHSSTAISSRKTCRVESVAVPGYVFWPDDRHSGNSPTGFGLFRAIAGGFELWLAALEFGQRGGGHGRTMLDALFATAPGRKTWVVRIPRDSRYRAAVEHL